MVDLIKLLLPFFHTPKSFGQVLTKLASFAFYETYIITLFLRSNPTLDTFFGRIESWGPIGKVVSIIPHHEALNLSGVVIAFSI
ncbi:MAG: hypothetical protein RLN70_09360, partial [Rhodospirillaceae bacterium]